MSDEWKLHARITGFQKRIAELERENEELRAEFGLALEAVNAQLLAQEAENECLIAQNLELELDAKNAQITRLQAVVRAAKPVIEVRGICYSPESIQDCWCSTCDFDVAFEELLPDDLKAATLKEVK